MTQLTSSSFFQETGPGGWAWGARPGGKDQVGSSGKRSSVVMGGPCTPPGQLWGGSPQQVLQNSRREPCEDATKATPVPRTITASGGSSRSERG